MPGWWSRLIERAAGRTDAAAVRVRVERRFMSVEGVVSVGVGRDEEGREAIVVGTKSGSDVEATLPHDVEGVPVVVREVGDLRSSGGGRSADDG